MQNCSAARRPRALAYPGANRRSVGFEFSSSRRSTGNSVSLASNGRGSGGKDLIRGRDAMPDEKWRVEADPINRSERLVVAGYPTCGAEEARKAQADALEEQAEGSTRRSRSEGGSA